MQVLIFIIVTCFIIAANVAGYHFLLKAIQPGEMFGAWQKVIDGAYKVHPMLSNFIGACFVCFAHLVAILGFIAYTVFMFEMDLHIVHGWLHALWYLFYVALTWYICIITLPKEDPLKEDEL